MRSFKTSVGFILLLTVCSTSQEVVAQHRVGFKNPDQPGRLSLKRNDTLIVNTDSAWAFNALAAGNLSLLLQLDTQTLELMGKRIAHADSILFLRDSIEVRYKRIEETQNQAYAMLHRLTDSSNGLVVRSMANTDKALEYITRIKRASYLSSGLMGGLAGGIVFGSDANGIGFSGTGAIVGLCAGLLLNYGILSL